GGGAGGGRDYAGARRCRTDDGGLPPGEHTARGLRDCGAGNAGGVDFSVVPGRTRSGRTRNLEIPVRCYASPRNDGAPLFLLHHFFARSMPSTISLCASSGEPQRRTLTHLPRSRSL